MRQDTVRLLRLAMSAKEYRVGIPLDVPLSMLTDSSVKRSYVSYTQ
jgi:hypothetical protein